MNYAHIIIKEDLKDLARKIREKKDELKKYQRKNKGYASYRQYSEIQEAQEEFRHKHIARCLLKGLRYEQIEQPKEGNTPYWTRIEKYKDEFLQLYDKYTIQPDNEKQPTGEQPCIQCM